MADKITVDELNVVITANKEEMSKAIGDLSKELNSLKGVANQSTKGITAAFSKLKAGKMVREDNKACCKRSICICSKCKESCKFTYIRRTQRNLFRTDY